MVNCNPETVSTDYDTSDRLFFEPLTAKTCFELLRAEQAERRSCWACIVQFGGQTPLKLAAALQAAGVPILGTSPDAIDLAEDRDRFQVLLKDLGCVSPPTAIAHSFVGRGAVKLPIEHRLSRRDPAVLRARRPGHGDRPR